MGKMMSNIGGDTVIAMPPLSLACLEILGETVVRQFQPTALAAPEPICVREWIDRLLPPFGIHVMPASYEELGDRVAATCAAGDSESEILVSPWIFDNLADEERPHFARATVIHELAHAILHVPVLRGRSIGSPDSAAPARVERSEIPESSDPEWQAWALAGAILMPRRTIAMLADTSARSIGDAFFVSEKFAEVRLERLAALRTKAAIEK
ncbi:MAG TPA: ImmA/IrrE family metallo-endopeptidase [Candidatus Binataceae bacterium]|nr:ImmA/IrrE family metallo-endopeptidase [Candidatus Binataceae bacterium]